MAFTFSLSDGTTVTVDGTLDLRFPIVILMHGLGGSSADMTAPLSGYGPIAFNRSAGFSFYSDAGVHPLPPLTPVGGFFADPPLATVTSWNTALKAAGFTTVTYSQNGPLIANDVTQLTLLAVALASMTTLAPYSFAFVAHSRGGLVVRSFLTVAARTPALAGFLARTTTLITLHSPNTGSGLAAVAATVNTQVASLQFAIASMGLAPLAPLAALRAAVGNPAQAELAPGGATLAGIAAGEPVRGITYHTFGGTSTTWVRLWAKVYTPDSAIPVGAFFGLPLPFFHWGMSTVELVALLDYRTFLPPEVLIGPVPVITETLGILIALAAVAPELAPGVGDTLVTDARARLPFARTHTTNALNHLEALYDPTLQLQVISILLGLANPLISGRATTTLHPFPARNSIPTDYTVTAVDTVSGITLTPQSVRVHGARGELLVTKPGASFTLTFEPEATVTFDPFFIGVKDPSVQTQLAPPYGLVNVPTGLP